MSVLSIPVKLWLFGVWPGIVIVGSIVYLRKFDDIIKPMNTDRYKKLK